MLSRDFMLGGSVRIIPVLDLKGGQVVRGIAGRREEYRAIVSGLTDSAHPVDVAAVFRDRFGFREIYLADLDAIAGRPPALTTYAAIQGLGCRLWIDAGVRDLSRAALLAAAGIDTVVVGLETVASPEELHAICQELESRHVLFSLDLKEGRALGNVAAWESTDPFLIARQALAAGVRHLLVLDLAKVGVLTGTGTETLCQRILHACPEVQLVAGGGIRDAADLQRLMKLGLSAVLVASALHDGRLRPEDCTPFAS